ncbi:hypothetical protein VTN96DRAFT_7608 [Rasamsonia emersonii]
MPPSKRTRSEGAEWRVPCKLCLAVISEPLEKSLLLPEEAPPLPCAVWPAGSLPEKTPQPMPQPIAIPGAPYKSDDRSALRTARSTRLRRHHEVPVHLQ